MVDLRGRDVPPEGVLTTVAPGLDSPGGRWFRFVGHGVQCLTGDGPAARGCRTSMAQPTSRYSPSQPGQAVRACTRRPRATCPLVLGRLYTPFSEPSASLQSTRSQGERWFFDRSRPAGHCRSCADRTAGVCRKAPTCGNWGGRGLSSEKRRRHCRRPGDHLSGVALSTLGEGVVAFPVPCSGLAIAFGGVDWLPAQYATRVAEVAVAPPVP